MTYPKGSKPTICDCPFTDWCEDGRQYLQKTFRDEDPFNYKETDCYFYKAISDYKAVKEMEEMKNEIKRNS